MKVENKNGLGNPYHDDNTGEFSSPEGNTQENILPSSKIGKSQKNKIELIERTIKDFKIGMQKAMQENNIEMVNSFQEALDSYSSIYAKELEKIFDLDTLEPDAFNDKYYRKSIGKKGEPKSIYDALKLTNPNFSRTNEPFNTNCKCCVYTYELLRRGYNVTAKPKPKFFVDFQEIFIGQQWLGLKGELGGNLQQIKGNVEKNMKEWGNGARAIMLIKWENGVYHVMNVENVSNNIQICDAQVNMTFDYNAFFEKYASKIIIGMTRLSRVDDLEYIGDEAIRHLVEKVDDNNEQN